LIFRHASQRPDLYRLVALLRDDAFEAEGGQKHA